MVRRGTGRFQRYLVRSALCLAVSAGLASAPAVVMAQSATTASQMQSFDIPSGSLANALSAYGAQSGKQLVYAPALVSGKNSRGLSGRFTHAEALRRLLEGSGLTSEPVNDSTVVLKKASTPPKPPATKPAERKAEVKQLPEILVEGSKVLNMDIARSRDDAQPYVIFERETIERSGATNIEEFLKNRLTENTVQTSFGAANAPLLGGVSQVNLRGLGTNQTLILIDGHRSASINSTGTPQQPNLNGIPIAAVERIEVLPTTASGIYGGGATGGVINIILRRDYAGAEVKIGYENTYDGVSPIRTINLSTGFNLGDGKTNVLVAASWSDDDGLRVGDRDFRVPGRAEILANSPGAILPPANPPLGATPNIRSVRGTPLFGPGTPSFTSVPVGYAGGGGLSPLMTHAGSYNLGLADTAQRFDGSDYSITNGPKVKSLMTTIRRDFSDRISAFVEMSASNTDGHFYSSSLLTTPFRVNATAPNNPFGQDILVSLPISAVDGVTKSKGRERRGVVGLIASLNRDWKAELDYTWSQSRQSNNNLLELLPSAAADIATGRLDVLRDTSVYPLDLRSYIGPAFPDDGPFRSTLKDTTARFAGPVGSLPAGPVTVSTLLEHRNEDFGEGRLYDPGTVILIPDRSQSVDSAYLETRIPFISERNRRSGAEKLELQIAVRHDKYTINSATGAILVGSGNVVRRSTSKLSSTDPTVALSYQPLQDLMLRASYGTGFLTPAFSQLIASAPTAVDNFPATDPRRGNQPIPSRVTVLGGGNPGLGPEKSESWSAGFVLTPRFVPGFRLSVDWSRIKKEDNITSLSIQQILNNEASFPERVVRDPLQPGDPFGVGPIRFIDTSSVNAAQGLVEAYDASLDYRLDAKSRGTFDFYALATWQPHFKTRILPNMEFLEGAGIGAGPLRFKGNAGVTWTRGALTLGWTVRYFDSYVASTTAAINARQGNGGVVASQTYHDFYGNYRLDRGWSSGQLLNNAEISFGIKNMFNKEPPFAVSASGADSNLYSTYGDPRRGSYYLALKLGF